MEESFSHTEKNIEHFLDTLDFNKYLFLNVLYRFEENDLSEIVEELEKCKLPKRYTSHADVLHEKFVQKLELSRNDLFICTDHEIYIKRYFNVDMPVDAAEKRACGISKEILDTYKQQFFPNGEHKKRLLELLPFAIESTLNVKKITPLDFRTLFIPVFVNLADIVVIESSDLETLREIRGLSFHLLREVFEDLMLLIAEDILMHFSNQDKKAIDFLSHFGIHETIDAKGNRYKPNPILDENKRAWNLTTIRSTMIQYKKAKQSLFDKRKEAATLKKKLEHARNDYKTMGDTIKNQQLMLKELEEKADHARENITKLEALDTKEVKFIEDGEEKMYDRRTLMSRLFRKEDACLTERNKLQKHIKELEMALSNKHKEVFVTEKRYNDVFSTLSSLEAQGHPMDSQYGRICRALAKTLSQR